jgi:hypothetical protein
LKSFLRQGAAVAGIIGKDERSAKIVPT